MLTSIPVHAPFPFVCAITGMSFFSMRSSANNNGENNTGIVKNNMQDIYLIPEQVLYHL